MSSIRLTVSSFPDQCFDHLGNLTGKGIILSFFVFVSAVERILSDEDEVIDVSVQDSAGRTALHIAAAAGNNPLGEW